MRRFQRRTRSDSACGDWIADGGFGLVEILVSMFLIGLLAVSFLPLLIQALRVTLSNERLSSGNQLLARELEQLQSLGSDCAALRVASETPIAAVDGGGY